MIKNIIHCKECIEILDKSGRCCLDIYLTTCNFQVSRQVAVTSQGKFGRGHPAVTWMEKKGFILTTEDDQLNLLIKARGYTIKAQEGHENHEFCAFPKEHV